MNDIIIDFSQSTGPVKALHGVNNSPATFGQPIDSFREAGIPYVRLHDTMGAYGGTVFVDVPNIFPDFSADENDPASYQFEFTDAYLAGLTASGCQIFYRLGVTIENRYKIRRVHTNMPPDFEKWARICEHIVAHYNEGWANGFRYDIRYWEIWNEPENPPMWAGTREDYFRLYETTACHLKKRFPQIRVGGYAGCGFYCLTRENMGEFYESFMEWFDEFLARMTGRVPVDFFSWHLYTDDPAELDAHARYVGDKLYEYGFYDTENIFNEWNYVTKNPTRFDDMKTADGAAFVAAAFALLQAGPVDKAMYYDALPTRAYCGLFHFPSFRPAKPYFSFKAFNALYRLGRAVKAESGVPGAYAVAAAGEKEKAVLLSCFHCQEERLTVDMNGLGEGVKAVRVSRIDGESDLEPVKTEFFTADRAQLILPVNGNCVYLLQLETEA
ncbi:MAG: hypothetical protein J5602_02370 [Clostridia bacterium]|nr:hypothetical protein [Clostridia bacterium]